jgi:hypothetical protein
MYCSCQTASGQARYVTVCCIQPGILSVRLEEPGGLGAFRLYMLCMKWTRTYPCLLDASDDVHTLPSKLSATLLTCPVLNKALAMHVVFYLVHKASNFTHRLPSDKEREAVVESKPQSPARTQRATENISPQNSEGFHPASTSRALSMKQSKGAIRPRTRLYRSRWDKQGCPSWLRVAFR